MGKPEKVAKELADEAPQGALTQITPELVNKLQGLRGAEVQDEVKRLFAAGKTYTIGPGDVLNIIIWGHPELALTSAQSNSADEVGNGYNVSPDGMIQFPFLGPVKVAGLTENQTRELLAQRLSRYITNPQLTVRIQAYRNGRVYIDGEVRNPGLHTQNDIPLTLPEAINRAGGFTAQADRSSIALTRQGVTTHINLAQLIRSGVNPNEILLEGGDMIRVLSQDDSKVFVLGEVLTPGTQFLRDGYLSLGEALGNSQGLNPTSASASQVYVLRRGNEGQPQIYHLDATSPTALILADGFPLKSRDVVFVDPAPVVRWNRVISMLLPSYGVIYTTTRMGSN